MTRRIEPGTYRFQDAMDNGSIIKVEIEVDKIVCGLILKGLPLFAKTI